MPLSSADPIVWLILVGMLFMPAWWLVAVPFWRGFLQTFHLTHPVDDAVREATERVTSVLEELRDTSRDVLGRVTKTVAKEAENWVLRSLERYFSNDKGTDESFAASVGIASEPAILDDVAVLATKGLPVYSHWTENLQPRLGAWPDLQAKERIHVIRDLMVWLENREVNQVVQAASRRMGLGHDFVDRKKSELREKAVEEVKGVASGFWYTLYCTVAFQILVVEALYALHFQAALKPVLWFFGAVNLVNLALVFWESWPYLGIYVSERRMLQEIAIRFGIQSPIKKAASVLLGQASAALFLTAFMARTALYFNQDRVLQGIHATVLGLIWEWPWAVIKTMFN